MLEETRPDGHGRAKGLVSSRESGRRVEARTFAPSAALRGVVEAYWVTRWDLHDQPPHVAELLTDPCVSVVLEAGQSRVVGVSTRLFRRELRERGLMRAVKLRAGAARALLGDVPLVSLSDRRVPFAELLGAAPEAPGGAGAGRGRRHSRAGRARGLAPRAPPPSARPKGDAGRRAGGARHARARAPHGGRAGAGRWPHGAAAAAPVPRLRRGPRPSGCCGGSGCGPLRCGSSRA
jgi:hypothetical protein